MQNFVCYPNSIAKFYVGPANLIPFPLPPLSAEAEPVVIDKLEAPFFKKIIASLAYRFLQKIISIKRK